MLGSFHLHASPFSENGYGAAENFRTKDLKQPFWPKETQTPKESDASHIVRCPPPPRLPHPSPSFVSLRSFRPSCLLHAHLCGLSTAAALAERNADTKRIRRLTHHPLPTAATRPTSLPFFRLLSLLSAILPSPCPPLRPRHRSRFGRKKRRQRKIPTPHTSSAARRRHASHILLFFRLLSLLSAILPSPCPPLRPLHRSRFGREKRRHQKIPTPHTSSAARRRHASHIPPLLSSPFAPFGHSALSKALGLARRTPAFWLLFPSTTALL